MSPAEKGIKPPAEERKSSQTFEQWRVTIQRVRPRLVGLVVFVVGLVVGLVWAYAIAPVLWTNADPVHLNTSSQDEWTKMAADQYALFGPQAESHTRQILTLVGDAQAVINRLVAANSGTDPALVGRLEAIRPLAPGPENPELTRIQYDGIQAIAPVLLVLLILVIGAVVIVLWGMYGLTAKLIVRGLIPSRHKASDDPAMIESRQREAERRRLTQEAAQQRAAAMAAPPPLPGVPGGAGVAEAAPPAVRPVCEFVSAYLTGDDYYDDSFSIEDESGGFLGETGAGISETIGVGAPKKVAAIEVWLFDKNDIRTITKVIMSEHAYNDEAIRANLAPKGQAVLARPGLPVELETQTLRIVATIRNLKYGEGPLPPNSYFDNLTLDIAAYPKEGASSAPGTAIGNMYSTGTVPMPPVR